MEHLQTSRLPASSNTVEEERDKTALEATLPKEKGTLGPYLYFYEGFWCPGMLLHNVISFQTHFQAQQSDIVLATKPKSGTTWLKALAFAITSRAHYPYDHSSHPLHTSNPHELVPFFEFHVYAQVNKDMFPLRDYPSRSSGSPRLFSTHVPYASLPRSIKDSECCIIYLCSNPFDTFVSLWKFAPAIAALQETPPPKDQSSMEECFDSFCRGVDGFGPYWDHVLGYWKESLKRPNKVLFMKYEDMKEDGTREVKRLAEFLGLPFTLEEEREGVIQGIAKLCSLGNLKDLEVNKKGKYMPHVENKMFFRKGEVGDWANYLTPSMVEHLDLVIKEKFSGSGLTFKFSP
ncbi:hypothetical protein Ancab_006116 [Ancistrocladus abbreviatus]